MAVRKHEIQNPFGVVNSQGNRLTGIQEKPLYRNNVNAGLYVISSSLLSLLEPDEYCDMTDLFLKV